MEACLKDLPMINLSYFPNTTNHYYYRPERQLEKKHLSLIFKQNVAKMAYNNQELIQFIEGYLANPKLDSQQRRKVAQDQLFITNGSSANKTVQTIVEIANQ